MQEPTTTLALAPAPAAASSSQLTAFASESSFEAAQRMARALCSSNLVPASFQGQSNLGSALIALEIAQRLGASPLMVMQNLNVIHGRPAWSSQFIIAALNSCGRFSPIRFAVTGEGDERTCTAWATDKSGERLDGPPVSISTAKKEGWFGKNGSKWQTMPELMLRYRAAAFFGRLYAPDILMGMQSVEEISDISTGKASGAVAAALEPLNPIGEEKPAPVKNRGRNKKTTAPEPNPEPAVEIVEEVTTPEAEASPAPEGGLDAPADKADDHDIFG